MKSKENTRRIYFLSLIGRGGTYNCATIMASSLSRKADVSILIPSYSGTDLIDRKVHVDRTYAPTSMIKTLLSTLDISQHIKNIKRINRSNPDTIILADIHPWYVMYWRFLKARNKLSIIHDVELHQGEASRPVMRILQGITDFLIRRSDKIIVLSRGQREVLRHRIPEVPENRIILSKHGHFDFYTKYTDKRTKTEPGTILFYGRIKGYKGLRYLLEALERIYRSKSEDIRFKLIIAGEGDLGPYAGQINGLKDRIEIHNAYVSDEDTARYFQRAAFVVLPYTEATQTGIIPIAYSFNKPVIVTDTGSLSESVIDAKTGIVVKPRDVKGLAEAMKRLLKNPERSRKMGIEGCKYMEKELDWDIIIDKLLKDMD